jgi:hypothetical protein
LIDFWGMPNLQVINRDVHAAKCATEARDRSAAVSTKQFVRQALISGYTCEQG